MLRLTLIIYLVCFQATILFGQIKVIGVYATRPYSVEKPWIDLNNDSITLNVIRPKQFVDQIQLKVNHKSIFHLGVFPGDLEGKWKMRNDTLIIHQINPITNETWTLKFLYQSGSLIPLDDSPSKIYYRKKKSYWPFH